MVVPLSSARHDGAPSHRRTGRFGTTMGDKSPKNARKSGKQKSDAKTAKDEKKRAAGTTPVV